MHKFLVNVELPTKKLEDPLMSWRLGAEVGDFDSIFRKTLATLLYKNDLICIASVVIEKEGIGPLFDSCCLARGKVSLLDK
jgi:hypothetical protein